jgi:hypothetical protein
MRLGERESVYLEFSKRDHRLRRKVCVQYGAPPSREVVDDGDPLEAMTDLIPSSAREFTTHWTQRSTATKLFAVQLRTAAILVLSYIPGVHLFAMNNPVTKGVFPDCLNAPLGETGLLRNLVLGTGLVGDLTVWAFLIVGSLLGGLQAIFAIALQFMKPSLLQRVIALAVALAILLAVGFVLYVSGIPAV